MRHREYEILVHAHRYENLVQKGETMIGAKIRAYIKENGIKQTFLAKAAGISDSALSDICIHDRKIEVTEYVRICLALNVPLDFFVKDITEGKEE